jgi:hypothetical protein
MTTAIKLFWQFRARRLMKLNLTMQTNPSHAAVGSMSHIMPKTKTARRISLVRETTLIDVAEADIVDSAAKRDKSDDTTR